jgi:O-antigen/teichoic acid export membrane protein
MVSVIVFAEQIIVIFLTEKWIETVPLMRIFCVGLLFDHLSAVNRNILYVKGRSDLALKLEFIKKIIAVSILVISSFGGLMGICYGKALYGVIALFLNSIYTQRLISVSIGTQISDIIKPLLATIISAIASGVIIWFIENTYLKLILGGMIMITMYVSIALIIDKQMLNIISNSIQEEKEKGIYSNSVILHNRKEELIFQILS